MAPTETGLDGWLRYAALPNSLRSKYKPPACIVALSGKESSPVYTAGKELQKGIQAILGYELDVVPTLSEKTRILVVGTVHSYTTSNKDIKDLPELKEDGFWLNAEGDTVQILGQNERGALYGAFEYLMTLAQGNFSQPAYASNPSAPIRWVNQWDNMDGTIERGYGGKSIFYENGEILNDLTRVAQYARLLSSVRLNGIFVNNVNSNKNLLKSSNMKHLTRIADGFRPWGLQIGVALYFDAPRDLGGLTTSDPLDPTVIAWWNDITAELYQIVPDLLGYVIKANSEGQPGPLSYGRTLADAANMFARALKPHGDGVIMYRAFVYNHHLDESEWKNDRANAAVDYFKKLDDQFEDNVIVQIKFGPIDFQVREPPSPLLANLQKTGCAIEFMVAQEYLGHQSHFVYMGPQWKEILDFDFRIDGKPSPVRDVLSGQRLGYKRSGYVAVVNVGNNPTWLGSHLAMSNLFAYGRLAWDPVSQPEAIVQEWIRLTFGIEKRIVDTLTNLSMQSWPTYESYSGNLGIQTLCDILGCHYGPGPGSQDGNGWGQWTRADSKSIGMDRTVATGTGNAGQYPPEVAATFENIETTPDELLLWFHHVPYTQRLKKSGKTVIQHFYDAHYEGAATAQTFPAQWATLKGLIDDARFEEVAFNLKYQAGHSIVWRDAICEFYREKCGIADEQNRVRNHPRRIEAQAMQLSGYEVVSVTPAEMASGGKAIVTASKDEPGTAETALHFQSGLYDIAVNYYDHLGGRSKYEIFLNQTSIGKWQGDLEDRLGHDNSDTLDGHSATRITFPAVQVKNGDVLKIVGQPNGKELAPLDYISVMPPGTVD